VDKLVNSEYLFEEPTVETRDLSDADFIVTTGRGRKKKAHIPKEDGCGSLCGHEGESLKAVDSETVDMFYSVCSICERLSS